MSDFPRTTRRTILATVAVALASPALAQEPAPGARATYQAKLVDASVVVPYEGSLPVVIEIDRTTTDSELRQFDQVLQTRGAEALHQAFSELRLGQVRLGERPGEPIRFARRIEDENGLHVVIVAARATTTETMFAAWPAQKYPYLVINLDLPPAAEGSGELIAAARFRSRADGRVELDNPSFLSSRLLAVRLLAP